MKTKIISLAFGLVLLSPLASADQDLVRLCFIRAEIITTSIDLVQKGIPKEEVIALSTDTLEVITSIKNVLSLETGSAKQMHLINLDTQLCLLGEYL